MGSVEVDEKRSMLEFIFWGCIGAVLYTYFGYPAVLRVVALFAPRPPEPRSAMGSGELPRVSVILAAYNEERVIGQRLENLLAQEYPKERTEIIVVSDGSSDRTMEIARAYEARGACVLEGARQGKALAQNLAARRAVGDLLVFTDADSEFAPGFIRQLVLQFASSDRIGCVVGNLAWKGGPSAAALVKRLYWTLETEVRTLESRLGLLGIATGAGFAVRRSLWKPLLGAFDDSDLGTPLDVALQGYRVVLAADALVYDVPFSRARSEFRAKIRAASKGAWKILARVRVSGCVRHPVLAWRTLSHHVLRWLTPFFLVGVAISAWPLMHVGWLYVTAVGVEVLIAGLAIAGFAEERMGRPASVASFVFNFLAVQAGMGIGLLKAVANAAKGPWETE